MVAPVGLAVVIQKRAMIRTAALDYHRPSWCKRLPAGVAPRTSVDLGGFTPRRIQVLPAAGVAEST